jgi:hypothetical protein
MSSQIDVLKSLVRSSALAARARLQKLTLPAAVQRVLAENGIGSVVIPDAKLTAAVGRIAHVVAATVSAGQERLRVDVSFDEGKRLAMSLRAAGLVFAPGGAKELAFTVEPTEAALDPNGQDVVAAIAGEIARALWRPALARAPRSEHAATVQRHDQTLVVDLRSVPEVRWAQRQRLPALVIEAIKPRAIEIDSGRLVITLALERPV